jgi:excisionase family DNA binding protein
MLPKLYSISETAEYLKISPRTVLRLVAKGELPKVQAGRAVRITEDALREFISKQSEPAIKPAKPRTSPAGATPELDREWVHRMALQTFSSPSKPPRSRTKESSG